MKFLPDGCVDAVITDPPYGTQLLGGGYGRRQLHSLNGRDGRVIANDLDLSTFAAAVPECYRLLPGDSWIIAFCAARRMLETGAILTGAGFAEYGELVWDKASPGLGYTIRYSHESALVLRKGEAVKRGDPIFSLMREAVDRADVYSRHPHEKPLSVLLEMAELVSGETILDPFCGSGTTLVAAKKLVRHFLGFEISPEYCAIARDRIARVEAQPSLFEPKAEQVQLFVPADSEAFPVALSTRLHAEEDDPASQALNDEFGRRISGAGAASE